MVQTRIAFLATVLLSDLAATVLIGAATQLPVPVIVTMAFIRPIVLFVPFGGVLMLTTLSSRPSNARFAGACGLFYLLLPLCVWIIKPGTESAADVYFDLHSKADLFAIFCFPFLIASVISVYLAAFRGNMTSTSKA